MQICGNKEIPYSNVSKASHLETTNLFNLRSWSYERINLAKRRRERREKESERERGGGERETETKGERLPGTDFLNKQITLKLELP